MDNDNKYINAFNLILEEIENNLDRSIVEKFQAAFAPNGSFPNVLKLQDGKIATIEQDLDEFLKIFVWQLLSGLSDEQEQKVIKVTHDIFSASGIEADQLFLETLGNSSQEDLKLAKSDLLTELDLDNAFDKLLD